MAKSCVASGSMPFWAVTTISYVPPLSGAAVPMRLPSAKVTPPGNAPSMLIAGSGVPVAWSANGRLRAVPARKVSASGLVISGACATLTLTVPSSFPAAFSR